MLDENKLKEAFPNTTVFKDQNLIATFKAASIPAFLRDWILKKKAGVDGRIHDKDELRQYMNAIIPRREDVLEIKDSARATGASKKFLARIDIRFNVADNHVSFEIPDLGITHSETIVEDYIWERIKDEVVKTSGGWGLVQLGYLPPEKPERPKGKLSLLEYKNFCPYTVNLDAFRNARKNFTIEEWLDVLLGAIDYNPEGYNDWVEKHTMLTRLLPFIEPRINLVELAPKGTGKSYLFGRVGKYGWLVSGGTLSRAKMFFDIAKKQPGLVATKEFVALDEIQSIEFPDPSEMQGALKAYMESGEATFGDKRVVGSAGVILLGNIPQDDMDVTKDMFSSLPVVFHESALLDRFHGFIQGRNIPRMNEKLKINAWALNTEYFSEIMHLMRSQSECLLYRSVVEDLIDYPVGADTRDTEAILRVCTAYLKLFFPHVTSAEMIDVSEFKRYCLRPAVQMRSIIRNQLQLIDPKEYGGKNVAVYSVKERYETA
ncbi:MAG: BREX system Lon protease-like protein BrxL [Lentisphaeria bacterium]|nr:BREX system Lon protease-like protein BrxL [Lentisphaeria bacterium]